MTSAFTTSKKTSIVGYAASGTSNTSAATVGRPLQVERQDAFETRPRFDLVVEFDDGIWVVQDRQCGVFGSGDSVPEALLDFQVAARDHRAVLEREDRLAPHLERELAYLQARIGF